MNTLIHRGALEKLRHCLGVREHIRRTSWGYRNYYACNDYDIECEELVRAGLMTKAGGHSVLPSGMVYYHATLAGMELVGVPKKRLNEEKARLRDASTKGARHADPF